MSLLSPSLEAFFSVATAKTVHGAAKGLGITQTGVTQRIRTLETALSTTLFTRSRRGMLLTEEGEALFRYCLSAKDLEGPVLAKIRGAGKTEEIRVCITGPTSILRTRVIPSCMNVMKSYRELLFDFRVSDAETWLDDLRSGTAQLAILPSETVPKELDSKILKPERYVLIGPKAWRKRSLLDIVRSERIIDFDASDQTSFFYLRKFKLLDEARKKRQFVNNNEALAAMIEAGLGYGVLTQEFAERFLQRCELTVLNQGRIYERSLALAWYPRPESPAYWSEIVGAIR